MDYALIALVVTAILTIASVFFTGKYYGLKARANVLAELLGKAVKAVEDDELTEEELKEIIRLVNRLLGRDEA
ncbi:MAG: hypothetical protein ACETV1_00900 [Candidatus Bathyarchaeia archaeon]